MGLAVTGPDFNDINRTIASRRNHESQEPAFLPAPFFCEGLHLQSLLSSKSDPTDLHSSR